MKILPVNNNYNPSLKARLPKTEIGSLIEHVSKDKSGFGIPKLYTLVELLDKFPGKLAEFKTKTITSKYLAMGTHGSFYPSSTYNKLIIDNKEIKELPKTKFDVLYCAMTDYKTKDGREIQMPQSVFEQMCWKNVNKTADDIKSFAI